MSNTFIAMCDAITLNISLYTVLLLIAIKGLYTSSLKLRYIVYSIVSTVSIIDDIMFMTNHVYDDCLISNILGVILLAVIYILEK